MLSHKNHADMNVLATMVSMVPAAAIVPFAAFLLSNRLMVAPWWLRTLHWMVCAVRGWDVTTVWVMLFLKLQKQQFAEGVVADFVQHIKHGKDLSDSSSVGGLNQAEVDMTRKMLGAVLPVGDLHPTYRGVLVPA